VIEQAIKSGMPVPKALQEAPELQPSSFVFLDAFLALESERPLGDAPASIPLSKVHWYASRIAGYRGDDLRYFVEVIRAIDASVVSARIATLESTYGKSSGNKAKSRKVPSSR
jgi:hypothetical protein